jgi:hypothetical protein
VVAVRAAHRTGWHGKIQARGGNRHIDTNNKTACIRQRPAGISRRQTSRRLDEILTDPVNHPGTECTDKTKRVADRDLKFPDPQAARIVVLRGLRTGDVAAQNGQIPAGPGSAAVPELNGQTTGACHVRIGDDRSAFVPNNSRPRITPPAAYQHRRTTERFTNFSNPH